MINRKQDDESSLKESNNETLAYLTEWKTQLTALVAAPFIGVGFVFDFLLRAKDFPELAAAAWGLVGLCVGSFFFFLFLLCAGLLAAGLGVHERNNTMIGWRRSVVIWLPRGFVLLAVLTLVLMGFYLFSITADGLGRWTTPYVEWLRLHSGR